jgi:hypothetical protein
MTGPGGATRCSAPRRAAAPAHAHAAAFACWAVALLSQGCSLPVRVGFHDGGACAAAAIGGLSVDPQFGDCGVVLVDVDQRENVDYGVRGLSLDAEGRILLAGIGGAAGQDLAVVRLLPSGERDLAFGQGSVARIEGGSDREAAESALALPDGTVVVVGFAKSGTGAEAHAIVARLLASGAPDLSFGDAGVVRADLGSDLGVCNGVVRRRDPLRRTWLGGPAGARRSPGARARHQRRARLGVRSGRPRDRRPHRSR